MRASIGTLVFWASKRLLHNTTVWFQMVSKRCWQLKKKSIRSLALCGRSFPSSVIGLPDSQLGGRLASTKQTTVTTTSTRESDSAKNTARWASWTASCSRGRWWRACGSRRRTCPGCSSQAWPRARRATLYLQVFNSFDNSSWIGGSQRQEPKWANTLSWPLIHFLIPDTWFLTHGIWSWQLTLIILVSKPLGWPPCLGFPNSPLPVLVYDHSDHDSICKLLRF